MGNELENELEKYNLELELELLGISASFCYKNIKRLDYDNKRIDKMKYSLNALRYDNIESNHIYKAVVYAMRDFEQIQQLSIILNSPFHFGRELCIYGSFKKGEN